MKYKKEVKDLVNDLKASVDSSIKWFTAVAAIKHAIEANVDVFGLAGSAIPHLEKARDAALEDIKDNVQWHKHIAKDIEELLDLEEEKNEVGEHLHIDRPCYDPNPELFSGLLIKPTIEEEVGK